MNLNDCLNLVRSFLSPENKLDQRNLNEVSLETILKSSIKNFEEKNEKFCESFKKEFDLYWKFALISINLLESLNVCLFEINQNNCYISVNDELLLNKLVELTVCFGIHYNLENNVGISIENLSKFGANISKKREEIKLDERNKRLNFILNILLEIKMKKREHVDIINKFYRKHLHDLLAALIQNTYSPNCFLVLSKNNLDEQEKHSYENLLKWLEEDLYDEIDGSSLVSSLLIAQSSCSRGSKRTADWFTIRIGNILTSCLLRPNSVMNVIRAILNEMDAVSNVSLESDWKKCNLVAQILSQCPRQIKIEDYIKLISPQLLNLYFEYNQRFSKHFYRVAGAIYSKFSFKWPEYTKKYFTENLVQPFKSESISSKDLLLILNKLHLVYVASTEPSWATLNQIPIQIIHLIYQIYSLVKLRVNAKETKNKCLDILKIYIKMMPNDQVLDFFVDLLKCELIETNQSCQNCILLKDFNFESFDEEEDEKEEALIVIKTKLSCQDQITTIQMVENRCKILTQLIEEINENETNIQFILYLFDKIKLVIENPSYLSTEIVQNKNNDSTLLDIENKFSTLSKEINLKIVYFTQIAYLIESINPQHIIDNHVKIIQFCYLILEKTLPIIKENEVDSEPNEMIQLIFSIISVFTSGIIEINHEIKKELQCLLPLLNNLKNIQTNIELSTMAENFYTSISTFCGVSFSSTQSKTSNKPLIEEINNQDDYSNALKDLYDPLVPVRAHGLVSIRKLIDKKDEKTLQNKSIVLEHLLNNIKFNDSYVYLAAINGLMALTIYEPEKILDILLTEYKSCKKQLDLETRLKIGEVLTKTVKIFNDLLPKYGNNLINAFLVGCKNEDEFFRSSSLSNLGETCKLLNYSLHQNIHEIINCLSSLIDTDKSLQVKRSAIMVVKMIIEGLKQENFILLLGNSALPLYKVLSKAKAINSDEIIQLNCQLTTDYLNDLMRNSLFPKQKFEKEIKISF